MSDDEDQRLAVCQALWSKEENSMDRAIERRTLPLTAELRQEGDSPKIVGHAAVFDRPADILGFQEVVKPGAFEDSIGKDDVRALWNHDPNYVLGRNKSGSLVLSEDESGLHVEIDPPDAQWARDFMATMERGDVDQMSFAFRVLDEKWSSRDGEPDLRELLKVQLFDVSPVTYPAYPDTDVQVRAALANAPESVRDKLLKSTVDQGVSEDTTDESEQGRRLRHMRDRIL